MPCRVSSGVHEWTNELTTVPTRGPAKLRHLVHSPGTPDREKRPRGALLQPVVETRLRMRSVGGSDEVMVLAVANALVKHRPSLTVSLTLFGNSNRWAVRLGRHAHEKASWAPKGWLRRVRTPPQSARAKASRTASLWRGTRRGNPGLATAHASIGGSWA